MKNNYIPSLVVKRITTQNQAHQAIKLINKYNNLPKTVKAKDVLDRNRYYLGVFGGKRLLGCIGVWENSFYSSELRHLVVNPGFRDRGLGIKLVKQIIKKIGPERPIFLGTVVKENLPGQKLLEKIGFRKLLTFRNKETGNILYLYLFNYQSGF